MSVCTFIAADCPLYEVEPPIEYPLHIDVDKGTIYDGDADDNYFLRHFHDVKFYTDKGYGVCLEWAYFTEGRAKRLIDYIQAALRHTDCVEIWHVWLTEYERPVIRTATVSIADLTSEYILALDNGEIWNNPDKDRPSYYCLRIVR